MSAQKQKWTGFGRVGVRVVMIVGVVALIALATLVFIAELTVV